EPGVTAMFGAAVAHARLKGERQVEHRAIVSYYVDPQAVVIAPPARSTVAGKELDESVRQFIVHDRSLASGRLSAPTIGQPLRSFQMRRVRCEWQPREP